MDRTIETVEFHGGRIKIEPDDDPESPRAMDNTGIMACWHRRYTLGDDNDFAIARGLPRMGGRSR